MKNDPTFKLVALIILAGVVVAFANPKHPPVNHSTDSEISAPAAAATE